MRLRCPRRERPRPEMLWRNSAAMKVLRTERTEIMTGVWTIRTVEMTAEQSQALAQDSIRFSSAPTWDRDKTYF